MGKRLAIILCIALLATSAAHASPYEVYGVGSRATAMGGAQGAAARDYTAIYYNPANLTLRTKTHFGFALQVVQPSLHVDSYGVEPEMEPILPGTNVTMNMGLVFPLGGLLDYRLAIGLALSIPLVELTRLEAVDPARPFFYMYQSLADNLLIAPAIGVRITDWLRIGVGAQILAALEPRLELTGDLVRRRIEERSLTVELDGSVALVAGIAAIMGPVELGVTYRDDLDLSYRIPVDFMIEDIGSIVLDVYGTTLYSPRQLNLGLAWTNDDPALVVALDATIAFWSAAPSPAATIDATLTDEELRPDEETVATLFEFHTPPFDLGAQNIVIPRVGIEWLPNTMFAVRAGYFYRPTAIPDQIGYSNVLDAPAHVLSLGGGISFADPLQVHDEDITIDFHVQWTHLTDRLTTKDPAAGADSGDEYIAGGNIWNVGIEFRQDF